jgi:hypothetical protein
MVVRAVSLPSWPSLNTTWRPTRYVIFETRLSAPIVTSPLYVAVIVVKVSFRVPAVVREISKWNVLAPVLVTVASNSCTACSNPPGSDEAVRSPSRPS